MAILEKFIKIIDSNLIYCLVPMLLTFLLADTVFKNRFPTSTALNVIRWIIIFYTLIIWVQFIDFNDRGNFIERASGYRIIYWAMLITSMLLPFSLLVKKLASSIWYVMLIAFLMKLGIYFERFVILFTSFHREYNVGDRTTELNLFFYWIMVTALQGFLLATMLLIILNYTTRLSMKLR